MLFRDFFLETASEGLFIAKTASKGNFMPKIVPQKPGYIENSSTDFYLPRNFSTENTYLAFFISASFEGSRAFFKFMKTSTLKS